jgi:hypothetical protein
MFQLPQGWAPNAPIADLHGTVHAVQNDLVFIKDIIQTWDEAGPGPTRVGRQRRGHQAGQPRKQRLGVVDVSTRK